MLFPSNLVTPICHILVFPRPPEKRPPEKLSRGSLRRKNPFFGRKREEREKFSALVPLLLLVLLKKKPSLTPLFPSPLRGDNLRESLPPLPPKGDRSPCRPPQSRRRPKSASPAGRRKGRRPPPPPAAAEAAPPPPPPPGPLSLARPLPKTPRRRPLPPRSLLPLPLPQCAQ